VGGRGVDREGDTFALNLFGCNGYAWFFFPFFSFFHFLGRMTLLHATCTAAMAMHGVHM